MNSLTHEGPLFPPRESSLATIPDMIEEEEHEDGQLAARLETQLSMHHGSDHEAAVILEEDEDNDALNLNKQLPQTPLFNAQDIGVMPSPEPLDRIRPLSASYEPQTPNHPASSPPLFFTMHNLNTPVSEHITTSPFPLSLDASTPTATPTSLPRRAPSPPPRFLRAPQSSPASLSNYNSYLTPSTPTTTGVDAPPMVRAHSSPGLQSAPSPTLSPIPHFASAVARSSSPLRGSPKRVRSPFRNSIAGEEMLHASGIASGLGSGGLMLSPEISSISEDAELEIFPRAGRSSFVSSASSAGSGMYGSQTFPRQARKRPASPLRAGMTSASGASSMASSRASSVPASPHPHSALGGGAAQRFNEVFVADLPSTHHSGLSRPSSSSTLGSTSTSLSNNYSFNSNIGNGVANTAFHSSYSLPSLTSSSVPSTPTSTRSRSPSISSLETIPDTPDAEMQAVEEDAHEREERRRLWEQLYGSAAAAGILRQGVASGGFARGDKRKRWSVCGAEKRGDLNLETIWED